MTQAAIEVSGLRKSYGDLEAVRGIDLRVERGEIVALLGPNGAGKTTVVEILEGYRTRDGGQVRVLETDPADAGPSFRERIGIVLQTTGVDPFLTVEETVSLYGGYYPSPRPVGEVLELVGLTEKAGERVRRLSGGQQRRLDVAIALVGNPELLFLDEPTTGFDPGARRSAWEMIRGLVGLGTTVLLTTHFMDEAQTLADRVAVMARGELVAEGSPATIAGRDRRLTRIRYRLPEGAPALPSWGQEPLPDGSFLLRVEDVTKMTHEVTGWALERDVSFEEFEVTQPSLEDVYLDLTGAEEAEP